MYATRLQHLCSKYSHQSPNPKKVSATRQPPAINAGPSGLYDNYQRKKDQELIEEATFMNTGLLPKAVNKLSSGYAHRHQKTESASPSKGKSATDLLTKTVACRAEPLIKNQLASDSRPLTRSLQLDSQSSLKLSTHSHVQLPYKELDRLATSRAEEIEIDSIKIEQLYSARVTKLALSHRSRLDILL